MLSRRLLTSAAHTLRRPTQFTQTQRQRPISTTPRLHQATPTAAPVVVKKGRGVGGIKGGLYGFLAGCTAAGAASYYYFLEEYRLANELLTEDVDALRASILRIEQYVRDVEDRLAEGAVVGGRK